MNKALLTLLLSFSIVWSATSQVEFTFGSDTISAPGGMVDVDVEISGFTDVISMQLSLNWDPAVFSFSSIENVTTVLPEFTSGNIGTPDNAVVVDDGELTISWSKVSTNPETIPNNTRLFTLRLSGVGPQCGSTQVILSNTPRVIEIVDNDINELDVTASGGNIDIYDPTCPGNGGGGGGSDLSFTLDDVSASAGSIICIPVTADNFTEILSFQSGVRWDPAVLSFNEIRDAGLQSVTANDGEAAQGNINVLWFFDQAAVSLANGATLFELCFEVVGNTGETSEISLVNLPGFLIEVSNEDGAINEFDINNASFTVGGDIGNMNGVGLLAENIFTENNPSICIPVTTKNFNQIGAFQAGVSFDPSILTYTGINQGGLTGVDVGNASAAQGDLRILWQADFSTPSVTLADDVVLFELCFDVVGNAGERSPIGFVNLPDFGIEFSSELGQSLEFFVQDGSITVGMNTSTSDLSLTAVDASVILGQNVCVDISVNGFTNIEGMGFALEWDQTVLTYVDQRNFNLSNLGNSSFSLLDPDRLAVVWTPTSPQSVVDGTSIFQICFDAMDECGTNSSSSVSFVRGNTDIEIIGPNSQLLNAELNNGTVSVTNCQSGGNFTINLIEITHPSCAGNTNGVVSVDFSGASGAVMCLWRRDSDNLAITANCNLLGALGGSYTLTATDQEGNEATLNAVVNEPSAIVVEGDIVNGSCTGSGEISLSVSGGTTSNGAYTYSWSGDLPPNSLVTGLTPGTYQVTVTDDNDCQAVQDFVVEDNSFSLSPVVTDVSGPDLADGSIDLNPASGADLSYSWSSGQTTSAINNLDIGSYTVSITDNTSSCSAERTYEVGAGYVSGETIVEAIISRYNGFGVSCNGESDGVLDGEVIGGCSSGALTIMLDGNTVTLPVSNITAGDHTIRIEDGCGNTYEETFSLIEPDPIVYDGLLNSECPSDGGSDGSVTLDLQGGTGVYSISSSMGDQGTGNVVENLALGTFTVVVQDENGCQAMFGNLEIPDDCGTIINRRSCEGRSIISPNGDGDNDVFFIPCVELPENQPNNLTIYDRWGKLVLDRSDYNNNWTGTDMSGEPLPEGGYMWVLTTGGAGSRDLFRGTVSILR